MLACVEIESGTSRSRILLANCPYEAGTVNSRVSPCNAVPLGWPRVSAQADPVECCSPGRVMCWSGLSYQVIVLDVNG